MAFTQVTIVQDFTSADGTEPSGTVTFTPTTPMFNGGLVVPAAPVTARLDGGGIISIPVAANTDPGTAPAGGTYQVVENINGVRRSYVIQVPHDQGASLTLYSLVQLATPPGVSFPGNLGSVTSVTAGDGTVVIGGTASNPTVRANVGTTSGSVAAGNDSRIAGALLATNNLSDVASASSARTSLGLGGAAQLSVGTTAGTVAAGNDARLTPAPTTRYVSASGNDANDGLSWGTAKASLGAAIGALPSGGLIEFAGGLTVSSAIPQPADGTTIRGRGYTSRITFSAGATFCTLTGASQVHFENFRLSLSSAFGGGFIVDNSFRCTWTGVTVDGLHNTGTGSTYRGQEGFVFTGNAGDNHLIACNLNNLGEAVRSGTIMNYLIGCNLGSNWHGLHLDSGSNAAGMSVESCTFVGTTIGAAQVDAHILVDVAANLLLVDKCWLEGCTTGIQLGSGSNGPTGAVIRDTKIAATTTCLNIQAAGQTTLSRITFGYDSGQTPTELTINATNAPDGTATGLVSGQTFDFAPSVFPPRWDFRPRYAGVDRVRTYGVVTPRSGRYFSPVGTGRMDTDDMPNGVLLAVPFLNGAAFTADRIGLDVATVGDAGSKIRLGIYADTGSYAPGALIVDAGQVAGDAVAVPELTISQALTPGLLWLVAVGQSITTTRPTVRVPYTYEPPIPMALDFGVPAASWQQGAYQQTGVTGALPSTFTTTLQGNRRVPRIFLRAA